MKKLHRRKISKLVEGKSEHFFFLFSTQRMESLGKLLRDVRERNTSTSKERPITDTILQ